MLRLVAQRAFARQLKLINLISLKQLNAKQRCLFGESVVCHFAFSVLVINQNPQSREITKTLLSDTKDPRSLSDSGLD